MWTYCCCCCSGDQQFDFRDMVLLTAINHVQQGHGGRTRKSVGRRSETNRHTRLENWIRPLRINIRACACVGAQACNHCYFYSVLFLVKFFLRVQNKEKRVSDVVGKITVKWVRTARHYYCGGGNREWYAESSADVRAHARYEKIAGSMMMRPGVAVFTMEGRDRFMAERKTLRSGWFGACNHRRLL